MDNGIIQLSNNSFSIFEEMLPNGFHDAWLNDVCDLGNGVFRLTLGVDVSTLADSHPTYASCVLDVRVKKTPVLLPEGILLSCIAYPQSISDSGMLIDLPSHCLSAKDLMGYEDGFYFFLDDLNKFLVIAGAVMLPR